MNRLPDYQLTDPAYWQDDGAEEALDHAIDSLWLDDTTLLSATAEFMDAADAHTAPLEDAVRATLLCEVMAQAVRTLAGRDRGLEEHLRKILARDAERQMAMAAADEPA